MPLLPGSVTIVAVTQYTVTMSATPAVGGTGPISYQWYRSSIYGFVPSSATAVVGQTGLTLNDTNLSINTIYYYVLQATDSTVPTPVTVSYVQTGVLTNGPSVAGYTYPQIPQFQSFFIDDFPYGPDPKTQFPDYRILVAFQMANTSFFNPEFFGDQNQFNNGFLLLSAHYMVMNIRRASQGMKGQFGFLQNNKSAGITVGIEIPQRIKDNPDFAWLCQTNYGSTYLHMIIPQLTGQMWASPAMTNP
jgi:hypothetical protein